MGAWRDVHVGAEGDDLRLGGIEVWRQNWRRTGEERCSFPTPATGIGAIASTSTRSVALTTPSASRRASFPMVRGASTSQPDPRYGYTA